MTEYSFLLDTDYFFIHIPKNAGTAIITQLCNSKFVGHHITVKHYNHTKRSKAVAVVRNPYDRVISMYEYCKSTSNYWHTHKKHALYDYCCNNTFEEFVNDLTTNKFNNVDFHFLPQWMWVVNENETINCNIIKFETLDHDLNQLLKTGIKLNKVNNVERTQKEYYTPELRKKVYLFFKKDFELFGYYGYTHDWFSGSELNKYCHNVIDSSNSIKILEIGCFEGLSATFFSDNFLHHDNSSLTCVDPYYTSGTVDGITSQHVSNFTKDLFISNIKNSKNSSKIFFHNTTSDDFFDTNENYYDFIYVDGCHEPDYVKRDVKNSLTWLKHNGVLWIDDYQPTATSVNEVLKETCYNFKILHIGYQISLIKL